MFQKCFLYCYWYDLYFHLLGLWLLYNTPFFISINSSFRIYFKREATVSSSPLWIMFVAVFKKSAENSLVINPIIEANTKGKPITDLVPYHLNRVRHVLEEAFHASYNKHHFATIPVLLHNRKCFLHDHCLSLILHL